MTPASSCRDCAFWTRLGAQDGNCRRNAPYPAEVADQIAHWPMTVSRERCGDGVLHDALTPIFVSCAKCRFWHTNQGGGLDPQDRGSARRAWWDTAGHCVRHAPRPSSDPGCRGFWRATSATDSCAEGELARPRPGSPI